MTRIFWTLAITLTALVGCKHNCCKKSCARCLPPGPVIGQYGAPPSTEILMPAPQPPVPAAQAPTPTFPVEPPRTSGYGPPPAVPNQAQVTLELPTSNEPQPRKASETSRTTSANLSMFHVIVPGSLVAGGKPSLDELDRLATSGVKQVAVIGDEMDSRVYEARGIRVTALSGDFDKSLNEIQTLRAKGPVYVCIENTSTMRSWWQRYFVEVENISTDAAKVRADRLAN